MVYKKYIKRNGKLYGPYYYHSRRVNGKVVSEYHGGNGNSVLKKYKNLIFILMGIFFLLGMYNLVNFTNFNERGITGQVALDLSANYQKEEPFTGNLQIKLKEGELIPLSSRLIFENNNKTFEYVLTDVVSENLTTGDFYVFGTSVFGNGEGYGVIGTKKIYPIVYFELNIENQIVPVPEEPLVVEPTPEAPIEEPEIIISENKTIVNQTEPPVVNKTAKESEVNVTEEIPEEPLVEKEPIAEIIEEPIIEEPPIVEEIPIEEPVVEPIPEESSPITGNFITGFFTRIYGFFFSLTPTGQAIVEQEQGIIIQGQVSGDDSFVFDLASGQTAKLISGSVRTDSENLSDSNVILNVENGQLIVSTNYYISEQGFGEDYIGTSEKNIPINLSKLNLPFVKGDLKIRLVYGNEDLLSINTILAEGDIFVNETTFNETIVNETEEKIVIGFESFLTEDEKIILEQKFGNETVVEATKAESDNKTITIRYEIGDYWIEANYNANLSSDELKIQMDADRIKWLKDIAKSLIKVEEQISTLEEYLGNQPSFT